MIMDTLQDVDGICCDYPVGSLLARSHVLLLCLTCPFHQLIDRAVGAVRSLNWGLHLLALQVALFAITRSLSGSQPTNGLPKPNMEGKRVAVVGSGISGLSAAWLLHR